MFQALHCAGSPKTSPQVPIAIHDARRLRLVGRAAEQAAPEAPSVFNAAPSHLATALTQDASNADGDEGGVDKRHMVSHEGPPDPAESNEETLHPEPVANRCCSTFQN